MDGGIYCILDNMSQQFTAEMSQQFTAKRKSPTHWSEKAIKTLLQLIEEQNVIDLIDGRRVRNSSIYDKICEEMKKVGLIYSR